MIYLFLKVWKLKSKKILLFYLSVLLLICPAAIAQMDSLRAQVSNFADNIEQKVIAWRHDFHEHSELGNHEKRSAYIIARYIQSLGIDARTGIVKTGVVGIIKGGLPGPVFALRADMDYLLIEEPVGLPFALKVKEQFNGHEGRVARISTWLY